MHRGRVLYIFCTIDVWGLLLRCFARRADRRSISDCPLVGEGCTGPAQSTRSYSSWPYCTCSIRVPSQFDITSLFSCGRRWTMGSQLATFGKFQRQGIHRLSSLCADLCQFYISVTATVINRRLKTYECPGMRSFLTPYSVGASSTAPVASGTTSFFSCSSFSEPSLSFSYSSCTSLSSPSTYSFFFSFFYFFFPMFL